MIRTTRTIAGLVAGTALALAVAGTTGQLQADASALPGTGLGLIPAVTATPGTPITVETSVSGTPGQPLHLHMAGPEHAWVSVTPTVTPAADGYGIATLRIVVPAGARVGERVVDHLVLPVPVSAPSGERDGNASGRAGFGVTVRCQVESPVVVTVG